MLPKTTDGHQFGLVPSQLQPKNFSSCYNQTANRNMKSHQAMLDSGPFPPSQLSEVEGSTPEYSLWPRGRCQAGEKQQQPQVQ